MRKKTLVIGGTHGDERTGVEVVQLLKKKRLINLDCLIANPLATQNNVRFIETNLNASADKTLPVAYEEKLAKKYTSLFKNYQTIIEFHNTTAVGQTCGIITTSSVTTKQLRLAEHFGLDKILIMPPAGSLSGLEPKKFLSLEISKNDKINRAQYFADKIFAIPYYFEAKESSIVVFRCTGLTVYKSTCQRLGIDLRKLKNFRPFPNIVLKKLDLPNRNFVPVFIREKAYGQNFGFQIAENLFEGGL